MQAGDLDRVIIVERYTVTTNDLNEEVRTWVPYATLRAKYEPLSDGETIAAGELGAHQMARFTIRSSPEADTINPKDRIKYGQDTLVSPATDHIWNIKSAKETRHGRGRFIEITAAREAD